MIVLLWDEAGAGIFQGSSYLYFCYHLCGEIGIDEVICWPTLSAAGVETTEGFLVETMAVQVEIR